MKEFAYAINDPAGIHARPAGLLAKAVKAMDSTIIIAKADGKSAAGTKLMALGILPYTICHVSGDVDLNEARPDLDERASHNVGAHVLRRHFAIVQPGAFLGELRPDIPIVRRFRMSAGQGQVTVLLQTSGHLGHIEDKVREQENFSIPEGVPLVALAGQTFSADVHAIVVGGGHQLHMDTARIE